MLSESVSDILDISSSCDEATLSSNVIISVSELDDELFTISYEISVLDSSDLSVLFKVSMYSFDPKSMTLSCSINTGSGISILDISISVQSVSSMGGSNSTGGRMFLRSAFSKK